MSCLVLSCLVLSCSFLTYLINLFLTALSYITLHNTTQHHTTHPTYRYGEYRQSGQSYQSVHRRHGAGISRHETHLTGKHINYHSYRMVCLISLLFTSLSFLPLFTTHPNLLHSVSPSSYFSFISAVAEKKYHANINPKLLQLIKIPLKRIFLTVYFIHVLIRWQKRSGCATTEQYRSFREISETLKCSSADKCNSPTGTVRTYLCVRVYEKSLNFLSCCLI